MKLVSFDAYRTAGFPNTTYVKAERFFDALPRLREADWVLFPEYWQIGALVFGLKRRIFPSLPSYLLGHDKIEMTRAFRTVAPENVPETLICANEPAAAEAVWEALPLPFVAKIPKSSMGEGVRLIETRRQWEAYLAEAPVVYAQEYLPIDRDLRIVVVGDRHVGGFWRLRSDRSFHNNLARGGRIDHAPLPPAAVDLALRLARALEIDHAGFDVAMVGTRPYVLEFNRLFGSFSLNLNGPAITRSILDYLRRKTEREGPDVPTRPFPAWRSAA